jgi:hypothetical protein
MLRSERHSAQAGEVLMHMEEEIRRFAERLGGPAMLEALTAFKQKRKPNFAGLA